MFLWLFVELAVVVAHERRAREWGGNCGFATREDGEGIYKEIDGAATWF